MAQPIRRKAPTEIERLQITVGRENYLVLPPSGYRSTQDAIRRGQVVGISGGRPNLLSPQERDRLARAYIDELHETRPDETAAIARVVERIVPQRGEEQREWDVPIRGRNLVVVMPDSVYQRYSRSRSANLGRYIGQPGVRVYRTDDEGARAGRALTRRDLEREGLLGG